MGVYQRDQLRWNSGAHPRTRVLRYAARRFGPAGIGGEAQETERCLIQVSCAQTGPLLGGPVVLVRPAGRTHLKVQVLYSLGKEKS
jgi:hypothetical protein